MGFNANPTTYRLEFDDPALEGMFVRVRRGSVQIRTDFDDATSWREQYEAFAQVLVEWNLDDDKGSPLPLTVDGLVAAEDTVVAAIMNAWVNAGRPSVPLEQPSTPGDVESWPTEETTDPDLEASMSMAPLAS